MNYRNSKGIALMLVLSTILVVVGVVNVAIVLVTSQSRFTEHQVNRIQAFYAAQAGMNLAIEELRLGNWPGSGTFNRRICGTSTTSCDYVEADFPRTIEHVDISVGDWGTGIDNTRQITSTTHYTRF